MKSAHWRHFSSALCMFSFSKTACSHSPVVCAAAALWKFLSESWRTHVLQLRRVFHMCHLGEGIGWTHVGIDQAKSGEHHWGLSSGDELSLPNTAFRKWLRGFKKTLRDWFP